MSALPSPLPYYHEAHATGFGSEMVIFLDQEDEFCNYFLMVIYFYNSRLILLSHFRRNDKLLLQVV